jgi:hypothetical protein
MFKKATAAKKLENEGSGGSDLVLHELKSDDPDVSAFYAQLSERERIAHSIAVDKLGTSYDVTRTHGFLKWKRKQCGA